MTSKRLSSVLLDECWVESNRSQGLVEGKGSSNKRSEDVEDNGEVDDGDELADEANETFFFKFDVARGLGSSFRYFSIS